MEDLKLHGEREVLSLMRDECVELSDNTGVLVSYQVEEKYELQFIKWEDALDDARFSDAFKEQLRTIRLTPLVVVPEKPTLKTLMEAERTRLSSNSC